MYAFLAFISLLLFFAFVSGVFYLTAKRVLTGPEQYGSRIIIVDAQGNGDHITIQAAIDAAQAQTPATDSRWLVLVAPGEYQEALTLYDYVDVAGYAPGYSVNLISPSNQQAITNFAEVTISNLNITGVNNPLISSGASAAGKTTRFVNCTSTIDDQEIILFQMTTGTLIIIDSHFLASGRVIYITGGAVYIYDSDLTRDGAETGYPIELNAAATLEAYRSSFINIGAGGGSAIYIHTATPTSVILHNCLFRKASGTESISTNISPTIYLAACVANAALDAAILGTHDIQIDSNY